MKVARSDRTERGAGQYPPSTLTNLIIKREPRDIPHLPLYDAFNIYLTGKELEHLKKLWHRHKAHDNGIDRLEILPAFNRENLVELGYSLNAGTGRKAY